MSTPFELENEGEIVESPRFICEACGFANVRLIDAGVSPAAKCTNCGMGYIERENTLTKEQTEQ